MWMQTVGSVVPRGSRPQRLTTKLWRVRRQAQAALLHSGEVCKDLVRGWACRWRHTYVVLDV